MAIEGLFWCDASADNISHIDNNHNQDVVVSGLNSPVQIDIDVQNKKIYWADHRLIQRSDLDGKNVETVLDTDNIPEPNLFPFYFGVVVDTDNGVLYCSDAYNDRILVADLDGMNATAVWSGVNGGGFGGQRYMAIDPENEFVYWCVGRIAGGGDYSIRRMDYKGRHPTVVMSGSSWGDFNAIHLDVENQIMYWSNRTLGRIEASGIDGDTVDVVVSGLANPGGITVDNDCNMVYWSDQTENTISRYSLIQQDTEVIVSGTNSPNGIFGSLSCRRCQRQ